PGAEPHGEALPEADLGGHLLLHVRDDPVVGAKGVVRLDPGHGLVLDTLRRRRVCRGRRNRRRRIRRRYTRRLPGTLRRRAVDRGGGWLVPVVAAGLASFAGGGRSGSLGRAHRVGGALRHLRGPGEVHGPDHRRRETGREKEHERAAAGESPEEDTTAAALG